LTYSKLIMYLVRCERIQEIDAARRLLEEMARVELRATSVQYAAVIQGYCRLATAGRSSDPADPPDLAVRSLASANELFESMGSLGLPPTQKTFGDLIGANLGFHTDQGTETALSYFQTFLASRYYSDSQNGLGLTVLIWHTLLDGLMKSGRVTLAKQMLDRMHNSGYFVAEKNRGMARLIPEIENAARAQSYQ